MTKTTTSLLGLMALSAVACDTTTDPDFRVPHAQPRFSVSGPATIVPTPADLFDGYAIATLDAAAPGNHDEIMVDGLARFGERFAGQILGVTSVGGRPHDVLAGNPTGPLTLVTGAPGRNLYRHNGALAGLGPVGSPHVDAIGEGAIAVLFDIDQSKIALIVSGVNRGGVFKLSFFRRDGSTIGVVTVPSAPGGIAFATSNGAAEIAGYSFENTDPSGVTFESFRYSAVPLDDSPPAITATVTGDLGTHGYYRSDVTLTFAVTDSQSAVTSTAGCADQLITTDSRGETFTCHATSAGGSASESITIKRDNTNPTVAYTGNAGTYTIDQTVSITCSAADATSGIATTSCADINDAAYALLLAGSTSFSATATDSAGNSATTSARFSVAVTHAGLCTLTRRFVTKPGIANALCQKLNAATAGTPQSQAGQIDAYVNQVEAQAGKAVLADQAAILIALARLL